MAYYCPDCGEEMVLEDDGDYYCDNCMCYYSPTLGPFTNPLAHLIKDIFAKPSDGPGPGCKACGNPAYPDCMDSCPLMDD